MISLTEIMRDNKRFSILLIGVLIFALAISWISLNGDKTFGEFISLMLISGCGTAVTFFISMAVSIYLQKDLEVPSLKADGLRIMGVQNDQDSYISKITKHIATSKNDTIYICDNWLVKANGRHFTELISAIRSAVHSNCKVFVILAHPQSVITDRRQMQLKNSGNNLKRSIIDSLRGLHELKMELHQTKMSRQIGSLSVFLSDALMSMQAFVFPSCCYLGFYGTVNSFSGPQISCLNEHDFYQMARNYAEDQLKLCTERRDGVLHGLEVVFERAADDELVCAAKGSRNKYMIWPDLVSYTQEFSSTEAQIKDIISWLKLRSSADEYNHITLSNSTLASETNNSEQIKSLIAELHTLVR